MKLEEMFKLSVKMGMDADPRGIDSARFVLKENNIFFNELGEKEKKYYDKERLENPYSDTRILYNNSTNKDIKKILVGIDIDAGELLIAKQLGDIDAVVAHHPEGIAILGLDDVMHMQAEVLNNYGVPINIAESLLHKRIGEVSRSLSSRNHYQVIEIARLLEIPFMCVHTVTDNLAFQFLKNIIEKNKPYRVKDIFELLLEIPEYQKAEKMGFGPRLFVGKKEYRTGIVAITEITGGTEGAHDIYEKMAQAGIGTVISMHQSEKHRKFAEEAHINVIIAGHMSSDSVGLNHLLDVYEKNGIEIVDCGGLLRVSR